jgi:peptidoglycan hydrolase CwlO-like protein
VEITWEAILAVAGAVSIIGGAWLTVRKIAKDTETQKKEQAEAILQSAKEEILLKEKDLQAKIEALDTRIETLEHSVEKDLQHMRETYNSEIRNLGQKIEDLRSELRNQHTQMVQLLTKMIENSKE